MVRYSGTDQLGVNAVQGIVLKQLGWIFRDQPVADVGIDAHIEQVIDGSPTGKLIAAQIKTGTSHFVDKPGALIYYGTQTHLEYWIGHSLPVLLIAHLPESNETYWVQIKNSEVTRTKCGWKIEIPKLNVFGSSAVDRLSSVFVSQDENHDPYNLSKISWTAYQPITISDFVPPTAVRMRIQFRMWSDSGSVPLLIRFASETDGGFMEEHAGPSGVCELMLSNSNYIYVSLAHPDARLQLTVLGWEDNL